MTGCDLSPTAAAAPLTAEDLAALLASDVRARLADPAAARTLVQRMRATLEDKDAEVRLARRDLLRISEDRKLRNSPLAAAVTALSSLTVEEHQQVFAAHAWALLEDLRDQVSAARGAALAAEHRGRRLSMLLHQAAADPGLPADAWDRLLALAAEADAVSVPVGDLEAPVVPAPIFDVPAAEPRQAPGQAGPRPGGGELDTLFD